MDQYIEPFALWLQEQGKRSRTIQEYTAVVKVLRRWFEERTGQEFDPNEVTTRDLHDWRSHMATVDRLSPSTIHKRLAALKTFWAFLQDKGYTQVDPTKKVRLRRSSILEQSPRWLSRRDQERFIRAVEAEQNSWKRARNLAMAQAMLQAGLRISEVAQLDLEDVNLNRGTLTIRDGKGGKYRVVPLNRDLIQALQGWVEERGEHPGTLFPSIRKGSGMTRQGVHYWVRKMLDQLGLTDYSAHSLRHSFCRNLIDSKVDLQVVAQLAGHESMETTHRYVTPSEQDLKRAVESISTERD